MFCPNCGWNNKSAPVSPWLICEYCDRRSEIALGDFVIRKKTVNTWPECEEFYDLMQVYRHAPTKQINEVIKAYENVKSWVRKSVEGRLLGAK